MKTADLHTHTTFSDGTYTPRQLVEYAVQKGLSAVAITDHDTLKGLEEAEYYGKRAGIEVIPGIEVSAQYEDTELHIVGLFVDRYNSRFNNILDETAKRRIYRNKLIVERLNNMGIDIEYKDITAAAKGGIITRAHFAAALVNRGIVGSVQEAFDRYIGDGKPAYIRRELLSWHSTINYINSAGGVAVLAHPLLYKLGQKRLEVIIGDLAKAGLTGIEAYYSTHSPSDVKYIKMLAQKYRLKLSGGSDFHGANKPKLDLGTGYGSLEVPYDLVEKLKKS